MDRIKTSLICLAASGLVSYGCAERTADPYAPRAVRASGLVAGVAPEVVESPAPAPSPLSADATLDDYLAEAALNNPQMEAAFHRWRASTMESSRTTALPNPKFTYRWYISEVETRVGPQRQGAGLAQRFPWFGKLRLAGEAADSAAEAARQRYETVKLGLFYEVTAAYAEYYYLKRSIDVTRENVELLTSIERVASTRYRADAAAHADVIRAQVELGKLDDRLRAQTDLRGVVAARLNAALNRPTDASLPWPKTLGAPDIDVPASQWTAWLEWNSPELKALDSEIERQRRQVDIAHKDYYPDVTLGVDWIETGRAAGPIRPTDSGQDAVIATLSVDVPIWRGKLDAGRRQARRRLAAATADRRGRANELRSRLKMVLYRYDDAGRKMSLYADTLKPKAAESLAVTERAYRAGKAGFIDLLDAVRVVLEFELAYERAAADRRTRLAELEMLTGANVSRAGSAEVDTEPADRTATGVDHD